MVSNIIKSTSSVPMMDLRLNFQQGWAYQIHPNPIQYDKNYFEKYVSYETNSIGSKLNEFRCNLVEKYVESVLDVGIGSGFFLKKVKVKKLGYDINPYGVDWLKENNIFFNPYENNCDHIEGFSFWDVLEHLENPNELLNKVKPHSYVFLSIPIFDNLEKIHLSRHWRPDEHLYYFTMNGLLNFMNLSGFDCLELRPDESLLGRENIFSFVFQKRGNYEHF